MKIILEQKVNTESNVTKKFYTTLNNNIHINVTIFNFQ